MRHYKNAHFFQFGIFTNKQINLGSFVIYLKTNLCTINFTTRNLYTKHDCDIHEIRQTGHSEEVINCRYVIHSIHQQMHLSFPRLFEYIHVLQCHLWPRPSGQHASSIYHLWTEDFQLSRCEPYHLDSFLISRHWTSQVSHLTNIHLTVTVNAEPDIAVMSFDAEFRQRLKNSCSINHFQTSYYDNPVFSTAICPWTS